MVWHAAERVYPGRLFLDYAVLGDDVVIADQKVDKEYASTLAGLGVAISPTKSLVSNVGCAEFAKRYRIRQLTKSCW